jgi:hypothetical protein
MAISAYGKALASMAKESVLGSVQGFGSSVKSAAMSEMPALTGAIAFARSLRKEAEKYQKETEKSNDEIKDEVKKQVKETRVGNVIGIESAKLLKSINANTTIQTRLMLQQAKFERQSRMFAEEESRERLLEQKKLLDAIRKIGMARGSLALSSSGDSDGGGGGLFAGLGGLLGNVLGGAGAVGGGLLAYKGGKYLLDKFKKPKLDVLGSAKRNPALGNLASKAVDAKIIKGILPKILGGLFGGPVGWALTAYGIYELLDAIFDFDIFSSAQASTDFSSSTQSTSSTSGIGARRTRTENRSQSRRTKAPLSVRNNNPGNLRFANQPGATRGEGGFAKFNSPEEGIEALRRQVYLDTQSRGLTLSQFIAKYAPPNENNTSRYVTYVSQQTGLKANEVVPENMIPAVMQAIVRMEGGQAAYSYFYNQPTQTASANTSRAGKRGPKFSGGGGDGGYSVATMLGKISERAELERAEAIRTGAGSIVPTKLVVPVEDEIVAEKIDIQTKAIKNIESSSSKNLVETRRQNEMLSPTRRKETRNERIAREANERFLAGFQALTTTKITSALEKALFPKGYGVTAEETKGELYRGERLGDLLGTQRFFNRTFGAEYGPLFDQLSRSYLELGATNVGQFLFGGTAGVDAQALTGQILGNIQRGKKDVALEQLLYGMTGTSSGYETLFAKYGFGSAQQGVQTMGNIFGAGATDIVRRNMPFIGEVPGQTTYTDPATGRQIPYGGLMQSPFGTVKVGGLNAQAVFVTNDKQAGVSTTASASGAGRSVTIGDPSQIYGYGYGEELVQVNVDTNKTLTNQHNEQLSYLEKVHDDDKAWTENSDRIVQQGAAVGASATMAAAQATGNVFTQGIQWLGSIFTSTAGRGGGTNISFGGGGQPTFGNFLMDLGKTAAINKLTSKISNPYGRAIANFGLNRVADVGIETIMKGGNIADVFSNVTTMFNLPNTLNTISNLPTTIGNFFSGTSSVGVPSGMPGINMLADGTLLAAPGAVAGSGTAVATIGAEAGTALSYAGVNVGATTATAAPAAASSTLGSQFTALMSNPVTWAVLAAVLIFGSRKKSPVAVHKAIAIAGNSNIDAKHTVFTRRNPPQAYFDAADQFLNVAFNTTKMLEIKTGKRAPFDYVYMRVESDRVEIDYGEGAFKQHLKSTGALEGKRLGGGIQTVQIPLVAKQIAEHIGEKFKTASSEDTEKIEKGLEELGKKSLKSITSGIETSIGRQLDLAQSSVESSELSKSIQAESLLREFQAPTMETFFSGEGEHSTGERLIYDFRTGKMVKQSETGFGVTRGKRTVSDGEGGTYEVDTIGFDERIIGINKLGKPIYNVGGPGIDAEDMAAMLEADPSLISSVTPAPGTIPAAEKVTPQGPTLTDMLKSIAERAESDRGGGVTVVNTDNSSQSVTNNTLSIRASSSDSLVFSGAGLPT